MKIPDSLENPGENAGISRIPWNPPPQPSEHPIKNRLIAVDLAEDIPQHLDLLVTHLRGDHLRIERRYYTRSHLCETILI